MHATVRSVIEAAGDGSAEVCVLDTEASPEHLTRGTARYADTMLVVVEPWFKSLETGRRIAALAKDLGIERVALVANKIRDDADRAAVRELAGREGLELAGVVPYDEATASGGPAAATASLPRARSSASGRSPTSSRASPAKRTASATTTVGATSRPRRRRAASRSGCMPADTPAAVPRNFLRPCLLLLLREQPAHGYDLLERLQALGFKRDDPGGLYRSLRVLAAEGLVRSAWEQSRSGPDRRIYQLTRAGGEELHRRARELVGARELLDVFLSRYGEFVALGEASAAVRGAR